VPEPVHAPEGHPAQLTHEPVGHSASLVHQHGTPAALHAPSGDATSLHFPAAQVHRLGAARMSAQSDESYAPGAVDPVHVPVHWLSAFEHLPVEQSESATQWQIVCAALHANAGRLHTASGAKPVFVLR
jgi:hypothetical protein